MTDKEIQKEDYDFLELKARELAKENIEKWGLQNRRTLLLVMLEELGELTQANLERYEVGKDVSLAQEYVELYDLMAVMYAYYIQLEEDRYGGVYNEDELLSDK